MAVARSGPAALHIGRGSDSGTRISDMLISSLARVITILGVAGAAPASPVCGSNSETGDGNEDPDGACSCRGGPGTLLESLK